MAADPAIATLDAIADALEAGANQDREMLKLISQLVEMTSDHGDAIVALSNRIDSNYLAIRPLIVTKSHVLATACVECGNLFAPEPGPELCGPCWVRHGRPETWPTAADTTDAPRASTR